MDAFFLRQMAKLLHIAVSVYDARKSCIQICHMEESTVELERAQAEALEKRFELESLPEPVVRSLGEELLLAAVWDREHGKRWILFGPVIPGPVQPEVLARAARKSRTGGVEIPVEMCKTEIFIQGVLIVFGVMTGREISVSDFWELHKTGLQNVQKIRQTMERDIFYRQENHTRHNPYEQEQREMEGIRTGDLYALQNSMEEIYEGSIGILAKEPLRHHKNVAIGNITLASRAAISGGVNVEQSFSMADSLIQQVEELASIPEVELFKREAKFAYARAVKEEQQKERNENPNPLIAGVKEYIFSHLHEAIQIADIAKHLRVNPNYLSHLFRSQENVTIKQYILREKIRRSRNLLQYSDYRIQEIGFYLGFSSQSHFTKVFQEIEGMTPNEYRKQFHKRESWRII